MTELDERFRSLDDVRSPDLWADIEAREPGSGTPAHRARTAIALLSAFAVVVGGLAWASLELGRGDDRPAPVDTRLGSPLPVPNGTPVSVIGPVGEGTLECRAAFPSSVVEPGTPTGVQFVVTNVSNRIREVAQGINGDIGTLVLRTRAGGLVADSAAMHAGIVGPIPFVERLKPGRSTEIGALDPAVIWEGPLVVHPRCMGSPLPALTLTVGGSGAPTERAAAIARAVEAVSPVFDRCRPLVDGTPVFGPVGASFGVDRPVRYDFPARCEAAVDVHPRFDVVTIAVISSPQAPDIDLRKLRDDIRAVPQSPANHVALTWWVITEDRDGSTIARRVSVAFGCHGYEVYTGGGIQSCGNPDNR